MKRPGRPMFRVVLLLLAWAAAGAIVNVALAWGCVATAPLTNPEGAELIDGSERTFLASMQGVLIDDTLGIDWILLYRARGVEWRRFLYASPQMSGMGYPVVDRVDCGWPQFALGCEAQALPGLRVVGGFKPSLSEGTSWIVLPFRPIWPGFAINTLFYAAMLWGGWLLLASPFGLAGLRKRRRIKRGLCPKCAYDLRGRSPASDASVCPECGAAVPRAPPSEEKP